MFIFYIVVGLNIWVFEGNIFDSGYATLDSYFQLAPWILLFLIPAITMRSFSDELQSGTYELLATKPITDTQIVLGKYFANVTLWLFTYLPTLIYYFTISSLDLSGANIDSGATWGSFIGLFFLGCVFIALSLLASAITKSQVVAFFGGVFFCYLLYDAFNRISLLQIFLGKWDYIIQNIGLGAHYDAISRGVVDFRDVFYFLTVIIIANLLTKTIVESRKW
jgi:ABC-2 type transport system permease protein